MDLRAGLALWLLCGLLLQPGRAERPPGPHLDETPIAEHVPFPRPGGSRRRREVSAEQNPQSQQRWLIAWIPARDASAPSSNISTCFSLLRFTFSRKTCSFAHGEKLRVGE
ncbi:hypothetical protein AV530_009137 [Patagioenas fasciata monilis]|uniref:Uncharacterized protein n=1 Tax=Patagioenas fasciata monilis TaxID=372326 RepID=A0A1V4K565_PATFA|nr:hypothetical protein AV530_009137 [Patagioenas fasciata monilis]